MPMQAASLPAHKTGLHRHCHAPTQAFEQHDRLQNVSETPVLLIMQDLAYWHVLSQVDLHPLAAPASLQSQPQQTAQPSVAGPSPAACDLEDLKMQSPSQMSAQPPRQPSIHLQEAKAWCPEGAELSEAYTAPHHIPGASNNDSESWQVQPQAVVPGAGGNADAAAAQGPLEGVLCGHQ